MLINLGLKGLTFPSVKERKNKLLPLHAKYLQFFIFFGGGGEAGCLLTFLALRVDTDSQLGVIQINTVYKMSPKDGFSCRMTYTK